MIHDLIVDTLEEDVLEATLGLLGSARLIHDPEDPEEPWLTPDGYLVVRLKNTDPTAYARELQRRMRALRVVGVYSRDKEGKANGDQLDR